MAVVSKKMPARPNDSGMQASFSHSVSYPIDRVTAAYRATDFFLATLKHAGAVAIEILEERALPDGGRFWRAKITESSRVPEFLRASDVDIYLNESTFHPNERRLTWCIAPNVQANRIHLSGNILLEALEEGTRLVYDVSLTVRLPFIGSKLESFGMKKIGREFQDQAAFLSEWLGGDRRAPAS